MTPACKVCGGPTRPFGAVDFNRCCVEPKGLVLPRSGIEIPYVRCETCGLLFTTAFDDWNQAEFEARIYNDDYAAVDPEFVEERPVINSKVVARFFSAQAKVLRIVDYGGGNGRFARELRARGFTGVKTYDPFFPEFASRPPGRFNLVTCFETLEHMPDPKAGAADIASMLHAGGLLLFSTLVQPADIEQQGLGWWYVGPRNGHVTLHTRASLAALWRPHGLQVVSFDNVTHAAYRSPPAFAAQLLARAVA